MLLVVDIGNSNIAFGAFKGKRLVARTFFPTEAASFNNLRAALRKLPYKKDVTGVIVSSVVPKALAALEKALKGVFEIGVFILGRNAQAPIKNLYRKPEQVGQDRLVNALAAAALYNKDRKRIIVVIDFGTAVTFDVISKDNEYLGGLIFPGIRLSLENLVRRAALLPKIEIKRPKSLIGKDTKESMRSGLLHGYASLCDGLIDKIGSIYKKEEIRVVATGGDARLIAGYSKSIKRVDPTLTLKGLRIAYERIK